MKPAKENIIEEFNWERGLRSKRNPLFSGSKGFAEIVIVVPNEDEKN